MYGIVEIGGHQYRVGTGDLIDVQKINAEEGKDVEFDRVLLIAGKSTQVGTPLVAKARVRARIVRQALGKKVLGAKRNPGLYFKRKNHRQSYSALLITEIDDGQGNLETLDPASEAAKKYLGEK